MTPIDIQRVFGRERLKMVTGEHVEVYREESQPGERRRYTKRFLSTTDGDFRHWTEREWRILARLVGHGIGPVPDIVQFDRGAAGRPALVQTYDAGVTVDHWALLLPVQRDGRVLRHVFEDCAHWWALARHCLLALDAIHELHVVHLDIKADNVCIPFGPGDFDPWAPGQVLKPLFGQITLIDFAFSLVSGEPLGNALPIGRQEDYDYQSPRLLQALEGGRRGDLQPTRQLDWRCDIFSLAAMLRRYLPDPAAVAAHGWTPRRLAQAQDLVHRLFDVHHRGLPAQRPHHELIERVSAVLRDEALAASLERGWQLALHGAAATDNSPTPVTRIARPLRTQVAPAAPVPRSEQARAAWWVAGVVAVGALSVPLLGEAWRRVAVPGASQVASAQVPVEGEVPASAPASAPAAPVLSVPVPAPVPQPEKAAQAEPDAAPATVSTPAPLPATPAAPKPKAKAAVARNAATQKPAARPIAVAPKPARPVVAAAARPPAPPVVAPASPAPAPSPTQPAAAEPPPLVAIATLPPPPAPASAAASPAPPASAVPVAADDSLAPALPEEFAARAQLLLAGPLPRAAQRAERLVLRVLHAAAQATSPSQHDVVTQAARGLRLGPDVALPSQGAAAADARLLHEAAASAFWTGRNAQRALGLQVRAFGANPTDPEIAGNLAFLHLKQRRIEAESARQLALYALTLGDDQFPVGRIEDWTTLAIASALAGRPRDARNAWFVALALAPSAERACRAAAAAVVSHGEAMRAPTEALLSRVQAWGRSQDSTFCRGLPGTPVGVRAP